MEYTQAEYGRIFIVRMEDGDVIHEEIEALAEKEGVVRGMLFILGGADQGSRVMVGPENGADITPGMPIMSRVFEGVHESVGVGTIFPDASGRPVLHLHMAFGRGDKTVTGCTRSGVVTWRYMEAVVLELTGCRGSRVPDPETEFNLLKIR